MIFTVDIFHKELCLQTSKAPGMAVALYNGKTMLPLAKELHAECAAAGEDSGLDFTPVLEKYIKPRL